MTHSEMLVDEFLPVYDVSDSVATVVDADSKTTWDALMIDGRGFPHAHGALRISLVPGRDRNEGTDLTTFEEQLAHSPAGVPTGAHDGNYLALVTSSAA